MFTGEDRELRKPSLRGGGIPYGSASFFRLSELFSPCPPLLGLLDRG